MAKLIGGLLKQHAEIERHPQCCNGEQPVRRACNEGEQYRAAERKHDAWGGYGYEELGQFGERNMLVFRDLRGLISAVLCRQQQRDQHPHPNQLGTDNDVGRRPSGCESDDQHQYDCAQVNEVAGGDPTRAMGLDHQAGQIVALGVQQHQWTHQQQIQRHPVTERCVDAEHRLYRMLSQFGRRDQQQRRHDYDAGEHHEAPCAASRRGAAGVDVGEL